MRRAAAATIVLILVSPLFGVILADIVGYHEPLDVAAEELGLNDTTDENNWTPFLDYTVPGLDPVTGYIVAGLMGVATIYAVGAAARALARRRGRAGRR